MPENEAKRIAKDRPVNFPAYRTLQNVTFIILYFCLFLFVKFYRPCPYYFHPRQCSNVSSPRSHILFLMCFLPRGLRKKRETATAVWAQGLVCSHRERKEIEGEEDPGLIKGVHHTHSFIFSRGHDGILSLGGRWWQRSEKDKREASTRMILARLLCWFF